MTDSSTAILRGRKALLRVGRYTSKWMVSGCPVLRIWVNLAQSSVNTRRLLVTAPSLLEFGLLSKHSSPIFREAGFHRIGRGF